MKKVLDFETQKRSSLTFIKWSRIFILYQQIHVPSKALGKIFRFYSRRGWHFIHISILFRFHVLDYVRVCTSLRVHVLVIVIYNFFFLHSFLHVLVIFIYNLIFYIIFSFLLSVLCLYPCSCSYSLFLQHIHKAWTCTLDTSHRDIEMKHGHAA